MTLRTARRGPNVGNSFWGCVRYPECKGIVDFDAHGDQPTVSDNVTVVKSARDASKGMPVTWSDRVGRQGWTAEYTTIGSLPEFARNDLDIADDVLSRTLSQSYLLTTRRRGRSSNEKSHLIGSLLGKILQRGRTPLPTLGVEEASLKDNELGDWIVELPETDSELGFQLSRSFKGRVSRKSTIQMISDRQSFRLDDEFEIVNDSDVPLFDSEYEEQFLTEWVPSQLGPSAANWFLPQVNLDRIFEAFGFSDTGARRVDFLFAYPDAQPLVIEIDGPEHDESLEVDRQRDDRLTSCGFRVIRVPNAEVQRGNGPGLEFVRQHFLSYLTPRTPLSTVEINLSRAVRDCSSASKVQLAIARAIQYGWLQPGSSWCVKIAGLGEVAFASVVDSIRLIASFDQIYGTSISPEYFEIRSDSGGQKFARSKAGKINRVDDVPTDEISELHIVIDHDHSPFHVVEGESEPNPPDIIIRSAYLPLELAVESTFTTLRPSVDASDRPSLFAALEVFLNQLFRKRSFRDLQAESILNPLRRKDSVVLLPTGAGKSIIYQLAGLLMPGVTLVVDPLISLIEDQIDGLLQYGIDRAAAVTSAMNSPEDRARLLKGIERGEYQFVLHSPERLQSPAFRSTLISLAQISVINLAVIDETHCVSEWGHDFRPAYLNVARNIRTHGKDIEGTPPPLLALTGTASRAVLRDVLTELDIDRSESDSLIRPNSFDRAELNFDIKRPDRVEDVNAVLRGTLSALPDKFGLPRDEFYRQSGRNTYSGIVFVPFVRRKSFGVISTVTEVRSATRAHVTFYSGRAPLGQEQGWDVTKRQNVKKFKNNEAPILVSTKAFGMGIDKPNIRYTIHIGMPGSLEGFYQEAGRAGRDRQQAHCIVMFSEFDADRTDYLLDPSIDLVQVRQRRDEQTQRRGQDDDISRALWFHLNAFSGQEKEIEEIERVLSQVDSLDVAHTFDLSFSQEEYKTKNQEKAIYRLTKIGVFKDYEVIWGSQLYKIYVAPFDLDHCKDNLLNYVQSAQPGRVKVFARELEQVEVASPEVNAKHLATLLIEFTYDVIERSRRRAIQEAMLLARNAKNDQEIRRRLLEYLQEGIGAEHIEMLLDEAEVSFVPWREIFDKITTPMDAGEIRGLSIRSLESFPDHPGLLLIRAVSEMMCSDANDVTSSQALHTALKGAFDRYDIDIQDIEDTLTWLTDISSTKAPKLGLPFAVAFLESKKDGFFSEKTINLGESLLQTINDDRVQIVIEGIKMITLTETIQEQGRFVRRVLDDLRTEPTLGYTL